MIRFSAVRHVNNHHLILTNSRHSSRFRSIYCALRPSVSIFPLSAYYFSHIIWVVIFNLGDKVGYIDYPELLYPRQQNLRGLLQPSLQDSLCLSCYFLCACSRERSEERRVG